MSQSLDQEFGSIRSFLWPVHRHELRKLLPMFLILFLICFTHSVLRNMKDSIVVTASGAEVIPFIKVWVMLPTAVLLTYLFARLSNSYSQERVFYIMISGFLFFFGLFAFVLYPLRDVLHPVNYAAHLQTLLPAGFKGLIAMACNWTFTGFYVLSELWGSIILTVIFWGFANEVTKMSEASRFYGVFGIGANLAAVFSGQVAILLTFDTFNPSLPFGKDAWEQTIMSIVGLLIFLGLITIGLFYWLNRNVLTDSSYSGLHQNRNNIKKKHKLSMTESFKYLSQSKYLIYIAMMVVGYSFVINLVEVVWKDQLKQLYASPSDYNTYMNNLTSIMGVISTITAFFMAKIISKCGWTGTALITPVIMFVTCAGFFFFLLFQGSFSESFMLFFGASPLAVAVFFGSAQNCLSKAAKFSVYDTTKEMAFIPLDHESKLKGKAAIDGVGSRLGKSGGSLLHQGLLMFFATVSASAPYVAVILLSVIVLWIVATRLLGIEFNKIVAEKEGQLETQDQSSEKWELSSEAGTVNA